MTEKTAKTLENYFLRLGPVQVQDTIEYIIKGGEEYEEMIKSLKLNELTLDGLFELVERNDQIARIFVYGMCGVAWPRFERLGRKLFMGERDQNNVTAADVKFLLQLMAFSQRILQLSSVLDRGNFFGRA